MQYTEGQLGRVFVVRIDDGEDMLISLHQFISDKSIQAGSILFLGALMNGRMVTGPEDPVIPPVPHFVMFEGGWEVFGVGTIYPGEGGPHIHYHASVGRSGHALTGCLREKAITYLIIEAVILEFTGLSARREYDKKLQVHLPILGNEDGTTSPDNTDTLDAGRITKNLPCTRKMTRWMICRENLQISFVTLPVAPHHESSFWLSEYTPIPFQSLMTHQPRFLPLSGNEGDKLGIRQFDIILVTGDAYVDHPSFGTALIGRVLWDAGFTVGIIARPDWTTSADFTELGKPRLFFGISSGNVDSMVNNFTPNLKRRSDDVYSPGGIPKRPDRATIVYTNRVHELFPDTPIVLGGIEASLRRFAHYDYWQDRVRQAILADAPADLLVFGMGERQVVEIARRLASGETVASLQGCPGNCF